MTILSAHEVARWWEAEGGPASRDVEWVAIAIGESGFDDSVVSSAGAIGIWQIMPEHAAEYGFAVGDLYSPGVNAYIAVRLSGYGQNCAAWDSAYLNIQASGRYTFLAWPERGSADWNNLATASAMLGRPSGANAPGPVAVNVGSDLPPALARWQDLGGRQIPALTRRLAGQHSGISSLYVRA